MKKSFILIILLITNILYVFSQNAIGEWCTHTPGRKVICVDIMNDKIFAATPYDVFYFNKNDNSIRSINKVNGLSDFGVNVLKYNETEGVMMIGYSNANIDIIDDGDFVINIPDIKNKTILGNKTINDIYFNGHYAYLSCGFGVVVVDMNRYEIKDTYIIGDNGTYMNINDITIYQDKLYLATDIGIYYADVNNDNLADYSQWTLDTSLPRPNSAYTEIETFGDILLAYLNTNNTNMTYFYNGEEWKVLEMENDNTHREIRAYSDRVVFVNSDKVNVYSKSNDLITSLTFYYPYSAAFDRSSNNYWVGDNDYSLIKCTESGEKTYFEKNGPYSNRVFQIKARGEQVWVASGGYSSTWAKLYISDGAFVYDNNKWDFLNPWKSSAFDSISDIACTAIDPVDPNRVYLGSYDKGIMEFYNKRLVDIYDETNSSLGKLLGYDFVYITDMDFDSDNNLWVANSSTDNLLSVRTCNGDWHSYYIGNGGGNISRMIVDDNDYKWVLKREGELIVFNDNNTLNNTDDDRYKTIKNTSGQGGLPGTVNCMAVDNSGTLWVGTTDGVGLFRNTANIFNNDGSSYDCTRILVPRNDGTGQADYLLSGESILSIAVDGANNLWFGTTNGVFYISNNGLTEYLHFTTENSPLLSNTVKDIAIDSNGNVYFATDNGIISYRNTATEGGITNSDVVVFPNPVRSDFTGYVGIKGLVSDALVKITAVDGRFVTHLKAQGGQAVWDCTNINGEKVQPGIYLIFSTDTTGKETYATKVLIMK